MEKKKTLSIFCDGGSRGNPGPSAFAFVIYDEKDSVVYKHKSYIGITTNNVAEYSGVLEAHKWLSKNAENKNVEKAIFILDSELVTKQLNGIYKIKSPQLVPLAKEIKKIKNELSRVSISVVHTLRDGNKTADALVNEALDENGS